MKQQKRKFLESSGYHVGNAKDFLQLSDEEVKLVERRFAKSRAVRQHLRQQLKSSSKMKNK